MSVSHAYATFGSFAVTLTVTDNNVPAKTAMATTLVMVNQGNLPPIAVSGGPYVVDFGASLTLNASASSDPNASCGDAIVSYTWNIASGVITATGATPTLSAVQLAPLSVGTYPVVLTVTDQFGAAGAVATTLTIGEVAPPSDPVATFTALPNPAACTQTVTFNASASLPGGPDRRIVSYAWDFGDGSTGSGVQVSHAFARFGNFTATLTVTDDNTPAKTATATTVVAVNQGNLAPVAAPGGPYRVDPGTSITLDGSGSSDPNASCGDTIVSYTWRVATGALTLTGATVIVSGEETARLGLGTYSVQLTVTDTFGATGTASTTLAIADGTPPVLSLPADITTKATSPAGMVVTYAASAADEIDPNPTLSCLPASGETFPIGTTTVECTATDAAGNSATGSFHVIVTAAPPVAAAGLDQSVAHGAPVTLDGTGSSDPDGDYPLSYAWRIVSAPAGSTANLADAAAATASLTPDRPGDYVIGLTVTDAIGLTSPEDEVVVSTFNTAPVADAGPDQPVTTAGTLVRLDGTRSYDLEGDPFTYEWTMTTKPEGSAAMLSDPTAARPTFVMDIYGDYVIRLVVSDSFGAASEPDDVTISSTNVAPVADAGGNQSVTVGDTVYLNGSLSSDANGDALAYDWSIVSKPAGSLTTLSTPTMVAASFVADMPGLYVVSLVVSDGFATSAPSNVTVTAISLETAAEQVLQQTIAAINVLPPVTVRNANLRHALTNKINAALALIEAGQYADALAKLEHDILPKTDGCAAAGMPDRNDWILDCEVQKEVYDLVVSTIELLKALM